MSRLRETNTVCLAFLHRRHQATAQEQHLAAGEALLLWHHRLRRGASQVAGRRRPARVLRERAGCLHRHGHRVVVGYAAALLVVRHHRQVRLLVLQLLVLVLQLRLLLQVALHLPMSREDPGHTSDGNFSFTGQHCGSRNRLMMPMPACISHGIQQTLLCWCIVAQSRTACSMQQRTDMMLPVMQRCAVTCWSTASICCCCCCCCLAASTAATACACASSCWAVACI